MDSQYKLLSELLSDQAAFITFPKTSLANNWGALLPLPPQCLRACVCIGAPEKFRIEWMFVGGNLQTSPTEV